MIEFTFPFTLVPAMPELFHRREKFRLREKDPAISYLGIPFNSI